MQEVSCGKEEKRNLSQKKQDQGTKPMVVQQSRLGIISVLGPIPGHVTLFHSMLFSYGSSFTDFGTLQWREGK